MSHTYISLMSNTELAEAIEYARSKASNMEPVSGPVPTSKRYLILVNHLEALTKIQQLRALAWKEVPHD